MSEAPKLDLVPTSSEMLTTPPAEYDFQSPQVSAEELAKALVDRMYELNGLGLSANQVGVPLRVFAMRGGSEGDFVCFNPRVVMPSDEQVLLEEGCLSYPGLIVKVKRPKHVRVRFSGPDGQVYTKQFTGMTARVFQHEMCHMEGRTFFSDANRIHRERGFRQWEAWKRRTK